jgi:hypothetical protein
MRKILLLLLLLVLPCEAWAQCTGQPAANLVCASPNGSAGLFGARPLVSTDLPASTASLTATGQVVTGGASVTSLSVTTGSFTISCASRPLQYITGATSAWTITAPANDGSCILLVTNAGSSAVIPTFSGFSVGSNVGDTLTTTASAKFSIFIWRINGTSGYRVAAHQ